MAKQIVDTNYKNESARSKLKDARGLLDRFQQYALLKGAVEIVDDKALQSEIESELSNLTETIKTSIKLQIQLLEEKSDYDQFISTLRSLEKWIKSGYEFASPDRKKIEEARRWFDDKRKKEGAGVSKAMIGGLKDKYVLYMDFNESDPNEVGYYINADAKLTYEQYLTLLKSQWQNASKEACGKVLTQAYEVARTSPSAARAFLNDVLTDLVDYKFIKNNRVLKIKEYEFDEPETERIKSYVGLLGKPCEQEMQAEATKINAINAVNSYAKYELLLTSREHSWLIPGVGKGADELLCYLPGLDKLIYETYGVAVRLRDTQIKEDLKTIQTEIEKLPNLGKDIIGSQIEKIKKQLDIHFSAILSWPGVGQKLRLFMNGKSVEHAIGYPAEFEKSKVVCSNMIGEIAQLKSAYERLVMEDENIRQLLGSSDVSQRYEGVQSFNNIKNDPVISKFLIFKNLSAFKLQQANFDDGQKDILEHYNHKRWTMVLQLCEAFKNMPNFKEKCPKEIKDNIVAWRQEADQELRLKKFQDFVARENYYEAYRFWERSQGAGINWQPINHYLEKVNQVRDGGTRLFDFYKNLLREFNLNLEHILLRILRDPDDVFDHFDELEPAEKKLAKEFLGEAKSQYSDEQFVEKAVNYLDAHLKKYSFEQKSGFLKKINYVANLQGSSDPEYPPFAPSFAQFEADKLSGYLTVIVQQEALSGLKSVAKSVKESDILGAYSKIAAVYGFKFLLNAEDRDILKSVEIADAQLRSVQSSPEQAKQIWGIVKDHFENDSRIKGKYREAKLNWYVTEAVKFRAKSQYDDALQLILKGFDDDDVGMAWQLYLEKASTCLIMEEFEEARKSLSEVEKYRKTNDILQLEVDINLGEKYKLYHNEPLVFINSLVEYWVGVDKKYKGLVEQALYKGYEANSRQYVVEVQEKINTDREKVWRPLLDLMKLEEIYLQVKPQAKRTSNDFVEQLIPTLYPTGLDLIREAERFNEEIMNHGISLKKYLSDGERIFDRLVSYENLLSSMYTSKEERLQLDAVLRDIINKNVRDQRKGEYIRELDDYVREEGAPKYYHEIQTNRSRIRQNLDLRLKDCEKKLASATEVPVWFESALAVMLGLQNSHPWKPLDDFSENLKDYKNFHEVKQFQSALDAWKSNLAEIHREHQKLREEISDEDFDGSENSVLELGQYFAGLPPFSDEHTRNDVVRQLKSRLTAQNSYTKDDLSGLDTVHHAVTDLKNEITSWTKEKNEKQTEVDKINQKIRNLQERVSGFRRDCYEKYKDYLRTQNAKSYLEEYLNAVGKIKIRSSNQGSTDQGTPRGTPRPIPYTKPSASSSQGAVNSSTGNNSGGFLGLFQKKNQSVNPLLEGIKSSAEIIYSISGQNLEIDDLLEEINYLAKNDRIFSTVKSHKSEELKQGYDALVAQKQSWAKDLDDLAGKNLACQEKIPYSKKEDLQSYYRKNQYPNMARRIIESDLIGSKSQNERDEVNAFREILMRVKWA